MEKKKIANRLSNKHQEFLPQQMVIQFYIIDAYSFLYQVYEGSQLQHFQQPITFQMVPNKATTCRTFRQSNDSIHIMKAQFKISEKRAKEEPKLVNRP